MGCVEDVRSLNYGEERCNKGPIRNKKSAAPVGTRRGKVRFRRLCSRSYKADKSSPGGSLRLIQKDTIGYSIFPIPWILRSNRCMLHEKRRRSRGN